MASSNSYSYFSISDSSSSSLDLCGLDEELILNCHGQGHKERFFFVKETDNIEHHYLESCFLCKKSISCDHELFMYKGDAAFCSENCRMDQLEMDESLETVQRRLHIMEKSSSSSITSNCFVKGGSDEKGKNDDVLGLRRRPTIANLKSGSPLVAR